MEQAKDDKLLSDYIFARCPSKMRQIMQYGGKEIRDHEGEPKKLPPIQARIILGGKLEGYFGFMPGLAEETIYAIEKKTPVYILGGFGA